jgi:hypothetical protein
VALINTGEGMNYEELTSILGYVTYKDWTFSVVTSGDYNEEEETGDLSIIAEFDDVEGPQHTRRWIIEPEMTHSEVVQTCLALVLQAEEHEARERFRYMGKKAFGPHFDVLKLVELAGKRENLSIR